MTDSESIPHYLMETIENLLHCLSLSQQNEMSFPSSLFAHERAFVHHRARQLGYYSVTKSGAGFSDRQVCIYKNKPSEELTTKYQIVVIHEVLSKVFIMMEKCSISSSEFRTFVSSRDYDDTNIQDMDTKVCKDMCELDFNFTIPASQMTKLSKFNTGMIEYRKSLPIYNYKQVILNYLTENRVVIIHGGIASGKSTQVPQYLMEKCFEAKVGYKIFLCEPYRITTVAIAERIAFERREEIGLSVGYQIPLETKKSATSILICVTPDVLLKMLISKEQVFKGKVIVILDEFEECDCITEFLLIGLKDLLKINPFLRLILMTNSMNILPLMSYFQYPKTDFDESVKTSCIPITSSLIPIQEYFLEDILMRTDYLNRYRMKTNIENETTSLKSETTTSNLIDLNTAEVIDAAMEKVWFTGEDDVFIFLLNMIKKDVISVNYQLKSNGITLLMAASYNDKMKYVSELVKSGADCTLRCQKGYTAVDWASKKNNTPIIEFLQYYLICNHEKVVSDREFIKLTASTNFNEHTSRLIMYYDNFYPEQGIDLELLFTTVLHVHAFSKPVVVFCK